MKKSKLKWLWLAKVQLKRHLKMASLTEKIEESSRSEILNSQLSKPVVLNKIEISGGDFSDRYYESLVDPVLNEKPILSLGELNTELASIEKRLTHSGLFKNISISLDLDDSVKPTDNISGPVPVNSKITLSQLPLFKFSSYSATTDDDASIGARYLDPNFLKNANSLLVDANFNYDPLNNLVNRKLWDLNLLIPLAKLPATRIVFNPNISLINASLWSSHEQTNIGVFFGAQSSLLKPSGVGIFTTGISATNRKVFNISPDASATIRADEGDDFKLGIQGNYKYDSRKVIGKFPLKGILVDITNELAGSNTLEAFSDAEKKNTPPVLNTFNKTVFKFEGANSFFDNIFTTSFQFEAGTIFDRSDNKVHVSDRFTLGGLNSLRGFKTNSVGLKYRDDYFGGTSVFRANFSLFTKLPNTSIDSPLRLHNFLNFGDNYNLTNLSQVKQLIKSGSFIKDSAIATGVGIIYRGNNAVVDLSYNVPLSSRLQDESKAGLNFSVALNFF